MLGGESARLGCALRLVGCRHSTVLWEYWHASAVQREVLTRFAFILVGLGVSGPFLIDYAQDIHRFCAEFRWFWCPASDFSQILRDFHAFCPGFGGLWLRASHNSLIFPYFAQFFLQNLVVFGSMPATFSIFFVFLVCLVREYAHFCIFSHFLVPFGFFGPFQANFCGFLSLLMLFFSPISILVQK